MRLEVAHKSVSHDLQIQQLVIILEVGLEEGITTQDLDFRLAISTDLMSKNIKMVSRFNGAIL